MIKIHLKSIGMLVGMIFGAGVFALPYATAKAGIFWGTFHFLLALTLMIFLHFWYGEVAYYTKGKHRFTGYAEILLGKKMKWAGFLITIFTNYGALLVYGLLGGIFLSNILPLSAFNLSLLIFLGGGILILAHFTKVASLNFYLMVALLGLVLILAFLAFPYIKIDNFAVFVFSPSIFADWFLPYGIWLFALAGFAAVPEVRDIFYGVSIRNFKKVILISLFLCAIFYAIFVLTVLGVSGKNVSEDALSALIKVMGRPAILIGSLLGFFAIFTSFIALGADLKNIFRYDFNFPASLAWLCVAVPPVILFLSGAKDFIKILGIIGAVGLGLIGILIVLMRKQLARQRGESSRFRFLLWLIGVLTAAGVVAAVISEI